MIVSNIFIIIIDISLFLQMSHIPYTISRCTWFPVYNISTWNTSNLTVSAPSNCTFPSFCNLFFS